MRLLIPSDKMTIEKIPLFSYGLNEAASLHGPTDYKIQLKSVVETLIYLVTFFYQTNPRAWQEYRGGNRAELYLQGDRLMLNMLSQAEGLICGKITKS